MYSASLVTVYMAVAIMKFSNASFVSEMALCADMCPFSPLVAHDGSGINECYEACKKLIHRVKFGDVIGDTDKKEKVTAPKPSKFTRIRGGFGKAFKRKPADNPEMPTGTA